MDLKQIIKMAELFRGLTDNHIQHVIGICREEKCDQGAVVFNQGETGDKLYIIGQGQAEVSVTDGDGVARPAVYLGEGQVFGEMALIDEAPRSASVIVAEDDTILYSITTPEFIGLCTTNTDIGYVMMRNIAQDLSFKLRHRDYDPSN